MKCLVRAQQTKTERYNPEVPTEIFDFIVIDECHCSIYNLWQQVSSISTLTKSD